MANISLAVGQVNITAPYLVAIARKVATPLAIEAQEPYPSPLPASFNVVLPAAGSIDPVNYYVDFYESDDGISLDWLLTTFTINAKNNTILSETRYYQVDGGGDNPVSNQDTLIDPYLNGKTISKVFKRGAGPLVPPDYAYKEYDLVPGGGIQLLNGVLFDEGDIWAIEISYLGDPGSGGSGGSGFYNGVIEVTEDTALGTAHRNKRVKCVGVGGLQMVLTLESVSVVPDGTFYYVTQNYGSQIQTRIIAQPGEVVAYGLDNLPELTIAPGEYIRIEKEGTGWEATLVHPGVLQVGERFAGTWRSHPNTLPENGALYDGDDYPRIWYWLQNKLPASHKVVDANVTNSGYTHPVGKEGLFVVHPTLKRFRMPNTQNLSERGMKNFTSYNADGQRGYDYPGGVQNEMVGPHNHNVPITHGFSYTGGPNNAIVGNGANSPAVFNYASDNNSGTENRVKNFGVIYLRRI